MASKFLHRCLPIVRKYLLKASLPIKDLDFQGPIAAGERGLLQYMTGDLLQHGICISFVFATECDGVENGTVQQSHCASSNAKSKFTITPAVNPAPAPLLLFSIGEIFFRQRIVSAKATSFLWEIAT